MAEPNLKQALAYQRAAHAWLSLAQQTDDPVRRPQLLEIAHTWMEMANESLAKAAPESGSHLH